MWSKIMYANTKKLKPKLSGKNPHCCTNLKNQNIFASANLQSNIRARSLQMFYLQLP